jgi:hypothetical protein
MARCAALSVSVKERRNRVIAGKFAVDFTEELHAMMKEYGAYDNLPAKQSRWEIYHFITPATFLGCDNPPEISRASVIPAGFGMRLFWKYRLVALISLRPFEGES